MQSEDRTIHFAAELIHQPVGPQQQALQKLYYDLSQIRGAGYDSTDFTNPTQVRFYSRRGPKSQSLALFLPDRVLIVEEWADISMSDFAERVSIAGPRALEARGVPFFIAHAVTIRSTFALTHYDDARVFLLDHVCGQAGRIHPYFLRPVAVGGLRFVLPETNEHEGNLNVNIESFRHSRNEIFVEAKGVFGRRPVDAEKFGAVLENIAKVRAFISENVHPFLEQYDQPQDHPV